MKTQNTGRLMKLFNSSARSYDTLTHLFSVSEPNSAAAVSIIDKEIGLADKKVLDIGCGTGLWSACLYQQGAIVHGIDFAEKMLNMVRQNHDGHMTYELLSMLDIDKFHEKSFDIVTASYVLHEYDSNIRLAVLEKAKKLIRQSLVIADYGGSIPFVPRVIEAIEKSNYKNFIKNFQAEVSSIFGDCQKIDLKRGGALYLVQVHK